MAGQAPWNLAATWNVAQSDRAPWDSAALANSLVGQMASAIAPSAVKLPRTVNTLLFSPSGVFFDDSVFLRWLVQLLQRMGVRTEFASFSCYVRREALRRAYLGEIDAWPALRDALREIGLSRLQLAEIDLAGRAKLRQCDGQLRLFPGVATTLNRLSSLGWQLGILTNSIGDSQATRDRLEQLGIAHYFASVLVSADLAHVLPDEPAFVKAMERLGRPASAVAFVSACPGELQTAAHLRMMAVGLHGSRIPSEIPALNRLTDLLVAVPTSSPVRVAA